MADSAIAAASIPNDPTTSAILRLPNELLGKICVDVTREYLQLRCIGPWTGSKRPNDTSPLSRVTGTLCYKYVHTEPFYGCLGITHVCWR